MSVDLNTLINAIDGRVQQLHQLSMERGTTRHVLQERVRTLIAVRDMMSEAIDNIIVAVAKPLEGAEGPLDWWGGPLTKTELKAAFQQVEVDMRNCTDISELDGLVFAPATQALIKQCILDMPSWWGGRPGSDVVGIEKRIQQRREELR